MDFTDPQTMVTILSSVLGPTLAKWAVAAMVWLYTLGMITKPLQRPIQNAADAFNAWRHQEGNTDIDVRIDKVESKPWVRFGFWLLDYTLRIKLGSQRATTITTTTQTATITTKVETPVVEKIEPIPPQ